MMDLFVGYNASMNTLGVYMNAQLDAGEEDLQLQIAHLHARLKIARHISCNKMSQAVPAQS